MENEQINFKYAHQTNRYLNIKSINDYGARSFFFFNVTLMQMA